MSAWYLAKGDENDWGAQLLNAALHWADLHGLSEHYRTRFEGITPVDVQPQRAEAENRLPSFPIWQIANELVVGCYLERVVGWTYGRHEPDGRQGHRGEWQFTTPSGRDVFVEVKSMSEPDWSQASGVFSRPDYRNRITKPLGEAYKQLPDDGRATLVVLVAEFKLSISHGIFTGISTRRSLANSGSRSRWAPTSHPRKCVPVPRSAIPLSIRRSTAD